MSRYIEHAKEELKRVGYVVENLETVEDGPNKWIVENLLELLQVFADQGHSGFSANYCASAFEKLVMFEPLTPLSGEDDEWVEVSTNLFQNKRCSRVFKDENGAYDIEGKIFKEKDGTCYTSKDSHVPVTFPYTPKHEYVEIA